jgi:hypothetical protein
MEVTKWLKPSGLRKYRSFSKGPTNGSIRPAAEFPFLDLLSAMGHEAGIDRGVTERREGRRAGVGTTKLRKRWFRLQTPKEKRRPLKSGLL